MSPNDELVPILRKLRLSGVLDTLDLRLRQALDDNLGHVEFVLRLLTDEVERRESKQTAQRLRRAGFEHATTLEDFDFHFNPNIPKAKVLDLATCAFVDRRENVLFVGKTGTGKSHMAQAIGHRACMAGYGVLFVNAHQMLTDLRAARADRTSERRLLKYTSPNLLILDDLGLRPLKDEEPLDLYDVIRGRYERGAIIVTSNRDEHELFPLFGDPLLASAAMDRLLHHSHVIQIDGKSYRGKGRS
jgi:DNA replication protein DnaC